MRARKRAFAGFEPARRSPVLSWADSGLTRAIEKNHDARTREADQDS